MKKTLLPLVAAAALILPSAALAANGGFQGGSQPMGGFQGPVGGSQAETVAAAKKCWDDAPVVLTGTIVERLAGSDDKYTFADSTGLAMNPFLFVALFVGIQGLLEALISTVAGAAVSRALYKALNH